MPGIEKPEMEDLGDLPGGWFSRARSAARMGALMAEPIVTIQQGVHIPMRQRPTICCFVLIDYALTIQATSVSSSCTFHALVLGGDCELAPDPRSVSLMRFALRNTNLQEQVVFLPQLFVFAV